MAEVVDLLAALEASVGAAKGSRATSVRLPEPVLRATAMAVEMGMDESMTAAMSQALLDRVMSFARGRGFAEHFVAYPDDVPRLVDVVARRLEGSGHVGEEHPDVVERLAAHFEREHPDWATSGALDLTVDMVIAAVEALETIGGIAPKGRRDRRATA